MVSRVIELSTICGTIQYPHFFVVVDRINAIFNMQVNSSITEPAVVGELVQVDH
jgi:hypothetical protein